MMKIICKGLNNDYVTLITVRCGAIHIHLHACTGTISSGKLEIGLNANTRDGNMETPLSLSLWTDQFEVATQLLNQGADIEFMDSEEPGLLYAAIMREKSTAALFLLDNGADFKKRYSTCKGHFN